VSTEGTVLIHRLSEGIGEDEIEQTKKYFLYDSLYFNKYNLVDFRVKKLLRIQNISVCIILRSSYIYTFLGTNSRKILILTFLCRYKL